MHYSTISGGSGNDTLSVGSSGNAGGHNTISGGEGNDTFNGCTGFSTISGGEGSDTFNLESGYNTVNGEGGNDTFSFGTYATKNTINGGDGNDTISLGNRSQWNVINGGSGNDTFSLGRYVGGTTFLFARGDGSDNLVGLNGSTSILQYAGVALDQLWFRHVGNDLEVSIIGTTDKQTISGWYAPNGNTCIAEVDLDNGKWLPNIYVDNLVQAMAAFEPPAAGQTTLPQNYQTALAPALAANWKNH